MNGVIVTTATVSVTDIHGYSAVMNTVCTQVRALT